MVCPNKVGRYPEAKINSVAKKRSAVVEKPSLSASRWRDYQTSINPHQVQVLRMEDINVGICYNELFGFTAQCSNLTGLLISYIKDNSETSSHIVTGLTKALPRLKKLKQLDIWGLNMGDAGSGVFSAIASPNMRILSLKKTGLLGAGTAFMSALHRLPHLSYLLLFYSGLLKHELISVLKLLPTTCPNIVYLLIYPSKFTVEESKSVCKLNKLTSLGLNFETADDCIKTLGQFPQPLEMIYLYGYLSILDRLNDFLDVIRPYTKLHYLVVREGVLDSEGEDKLRKLMRKKGGRLVVDTKDSQGFKEYKNRIITLRNYCLSS